MSSDRSGPPGRPVLLLGLDGLGFPFLDAPLVVDAMPNLGALLARSATGPLRSTVPPYTAPAWTSITTGVHPGRHGVYGFTDATGRPVSDLLVAAPRLWDHVGEAGGRSVVVNVPITYPPRPLAGVLVSGMPVPAKAPAAWPAPLGADLASFGYVVDVAVREGGREGSASLDKLRRMTEARGRAVTWLATTEPWDLLVVVFVLPDRLGHPWWKQLVPGHHLYDTGGAERLRRRVTASLRTLDDAIGELLGALPPATAVVVCSDHGLGPLRGELFFDLVLAREGLIAGSPVGSLRRTLMRAGRSRLATLAPGGVYRWVRERVAAPGEASRQAWTGPPYEAGVHLADPDDQALRAAVVTLLAELRDPDGQALVRSVTSREALYRGALLEGAPHLVCEMADESVDLHDGLHAPQPWVSRDELAWGTHTSTGVIAIAGADVPLPLQGRAPDVAATVLELLGLRVDGLDGAALVRTSHGEHVPVTGPARPRENEEVYSAEEEAAVMEHLRGLGYVD